MTQTTLPGTTDRRIDALLALLSDNAMIVISGAKIAREIGVTRTTVWRWIEKLRALGVRVKGHPRNGYQIEKVPDVLVPKLLRKRLPQGTFCKRIHHFFKIDSTNSVAMLLGAAGRTAWNSGNRRGTNSWTRTCRPSVAFRKNKRYLHDGALRPQLSPQQAPLITIVAGLAVRDAIQEQTGLAPDLRWPNDLLFGRRKFCGIQTEMNAEQDRIHFVAVGIGINVNHERIPDELAGIATLAANRNESASYSRVEIVARLLRHLDSYYNRLLSEGAEPIVARFCEVSTYARGKRVRVTTTTTERIPARLRASNPEACCV